MENMACITASKKSSRKIKNMTPMIPGSLPIPS